MPLLRGRQFLHTPGPTNIPDRILRAMDRPVIDFHGPEFVAAAAQAFAGLKRIFKTEHHVIAWASTGHGAWEAALQNVCSPGDHVLIPETGIFSTWWGEMAETFGIVVERIPGDRRHGVDPEAVEEHLRRDRERRIRAVCVVHNETSTGVLSRCAEIRRAMDRADHPALYLVDTISSLASMDFRMDEWRVDVAVGGSQKGLMLPTGLGIIALSPKALEAAAASTIPKRYWDFRRALPDGVTPKFPGTAPVNIVLGLCEALRMIEEEGLDAVFARHARLAEGVRRAIRAWSVGGGPELFSLDPEEHSNSVSAVLMPDGVDAEEFRRVCFERFNVVIGGGLLDMRGRVFRIGHLGDLNEPMVWGTLAAIEATLDLCQVPHGRGGTEAAIRYLTDAA